MENDSETRSEYSYFPFQSIISGVNLDVVMMKSVWMHFEVFNGDLLKDYVLLLYSKKLPQQLLHITTNYELFAWISEIG